MKVGLIVICRMSSSRLPGKMLKEIEGKPLLQYILERLRYVQTADGLVVATSLDGTDDAIEAFCEAYGVACFRGSLENVAGRFLDCAQSREMEYAIRINGDNLFADPVLIDQMIAKIPDGYDFITNVPNRTFPYGMSVEILRTAFYEKILQAFQDQPYYQEHVTKYLYDQPTLGRRLVVENTEFPECAGVQLAIDDTDDFETATSVIEKMARPHWDYTFAEVVSFIRQIRETEHG